MRTATYRGEQRRWGFEKYSNLHTENHTVLDGLVEHGYAGMDSRTRVRLFMEGIKDDRLNHIKATVLADSALRADFKRVVALFSDFIKQDATMNRTTERNGRQISAVGTSTLDESQADMTVEDRYYKKPEYKNLSDAQKLGLKIKRQKRKGKDDGKKGNKRRKTDLSAKQLKALAVQVAKLNVDDDNDDEPSEEKDDDPNDAGDKEQTTGKNRQNKALTRKK